MLPIEFKKFPKIARLSREVIVTEKIDGTNAAVVIVDSLSSGMPPNTIAMVDGYAICAQSRTRFVTVEHDNFGFAAWVKRYADELVKGLGVGYHFGEWFGAGIQRGYGLQEKRFALFHVLRWAPHATHPTCCHTVPLLWRGNFSDLDVEGTLRALAKNGSYAVPGFMHPEGLVVFHVAANIGLKKTLENDALPKSTVGCGRSVFAE